MSDAMAPEQLAVAVAIAQFEWPVDRRFVLDAGLDPAVADVVAASSARRSGRAEARAEMSRQPGPGELLVRVRAAGLNRADVLDLERGVDRAPGRELAGEVLAVGEGGAGWSVGDRVMSRGAGFASEAIVSSRDAMAVPRSFTWEEAGALPIALLTMHDAIITNGLARPGSRVLVHAATSGVGVAGVQIAAAIGVATVFATSRSATKLGVLQAHVGDLTPCEVVGIDTSTTTFESVATDVDLIVDNVGASVLRGNLEAARIGGRIVQVGRLGGRHAEIDLDELARKRVSLVGVTFRTRTSDEVAGVTQGALADLGDRLERVRPASSAPTRSAICALRSTRSRPMLTSASSSSSPEQ